MQILAFNTLGPSLRNKLEIKTAAHAGLIYERNGNGKQHKGKESGGFIKQQPCGSTRYKGVCCRS